MYAHRVLGALTGAVFDEVSRMLGGCPGEEAMSVTAAAADQESNGIQR